MHEISTIFQEDASIMHETCVGLGWVGLEACVPATAAALIVSHSISRRFFAKIWVESDRLDSTKREASFLLLLAQLNYY